MANRPRIVWKQIEGFPRYKISDRGDVVDTEKNRKLSKWTTNAGYEYVQLTKDGNHYTKYVHRLLAEAFIPNPNGYDTVDHLNGNNQDNSLSNLQWLSTIDNVLKAHADKGHNVNRWFSAFKDGEFVGRWTNQHEAARELGVKQGLISACLRGKQKTTGGYAFKYDD